MLKGFLCFAVIFCCFSSVFTQENQRRTFSGTILTQQFEAIPNVEISVRNGDGKLNAATDAEGNFSLKVPNESLSVTFSGKNIEPQTRIFAVTDKIE
ncbi:MAG TPA: carboxypeptidase-like regulatory domain-containing protein, partial [Pyrinomonadaceae bacterium]|nr:carboxypeptidase-like regulatory domain-containing protein [Pyrinomonadaceae bacterium]